MYVLKNASLPVTRVREKEKRITRSCWFYFARKTWESMWWLIFLLLIKSKLNKSTLGVALCNNPVLNGEHKGSPSSLTCSTMSNGQNWIRTWMLIRYTILTLTRWLQSIVFLVKSILQISGMATMVWSLMRLNNRLWSWEKLTQIFVCITK